MKNLLFLSLLALATQLLFSCRPEKKERLLLMWGRKKDLFPSGGMIREMVGPLRREPLLKFRVPEGNLSENLPLIKN